MAEITDPPSGGTVKTTTPVVSGTGAPGSIVTIRAQRDDQEVFGCRDVVAESGSWSCRFLHAVEPGTWDLDVLEVDQDRVGTHSWVTGIVIQGLEAPPSATPEIPPLDTLEWPRKEEREAHPRDGLATPAPGSTRPHPDGKKETEALPQDGLATPAPESTRPHPDGKKETEALPQDGLATPAPESTRPHPDRKDWAHKDGKDAKEHGKDAKEPRPEDKDWAHKDSKDAKEHGKDAKEPRVEGKDWAHKDGKDGKEPRKDDHKWSEKDGKQWAHENGKDGWNKDDRKWDHKKDDKDAPYLDGSQWPHTDGMGDPYRDDKSTATDSTHAEDELPLTGVSPAPIVMAGTALLGAGMIMLGFGSRRRPFQG